MMIKISHNKNNNKNNKDKSSKSKEICLLFFSLAKVLKLNNKGKYGGIIYRRVSNNSNNNRNRNSKNYNKVKHLSLLRDLWLLFSYSNKRYMNKLRRRILRLNLLI